MSSKGQITSNLNNFSEISLQFILYSTQIDYTDGVMRYITILCL